jgi:release factor glutamine methyltransferase
VQPLAPDRFDAVVTRLRAAGCVFAEDEAALLIDTAGSTGELDALVQRRVSGTPLEYILGWAAFCGLRIAIDPGVFVPRRRTELLAREAAAIMRAPQVVVDLCCGSGAVGAALAAWHPGIRLFAVDIDPVEVACARRNLLPPARVLEGDLYAGLPGSLLGRVDVLVANAPYVPTDAIPYMPPEARLYEARLALDGGSDGADLHRRIAAGASSWLAAGGTLLIEAGEDQAAVTAAAMRDNGLLPRIVHDDDLDGTVVIGTQQTPSYR